MAPAAAPSGGGGNIKVVVRVRPFNGRGEPLPCGYQKEKAGKLMLLPDRT
jgi:hypothetical protein